MRPLIIERPELQTPTQRYGYLSVTLICWFLWLYLFVPLLSLVAWVLGATLVYQVMLQNLDTAELVALLRVYGAGIASLTGVYLLWAVTSYLRFRNVERRSFAPSTDDAALARSHHLDAAELAALRTGGRTDVPAELRARMFDPDRDTTERASSNGSPLPPAGAPR